LLGPSDTARPLQSCLREPEAAKPDVLPRARLRTQAARRDKEAQRQAALRAAQQRADEQRAARQKAQARPLSG